MSVSATCDRTNRVKMDLVESADKVWRAEKSFDAAHEVKANPKRAQRNQSA